MGGMDLFVLARETKETAETSNTQSDLQTTPQSFVQDIILNRSKISTDNPTDQMFVVQLVCTFYIFPLLLQLISRKEIIYIHCM